MSVWTFFDEKTGLPLGTTFSGRDADLGPNTPEGAVAVPGRHDHRNRKIEDGFVVPYQPPQPSQNHQWDADVELWIVSPETVEAIRKDAIARRSIESIEALSQRAVREALLQMLPEGETKARLQETDDAISAKRADLIGRASDSTDSPADAVSVLSAAAP